MHVYSSLRCKLVRFDFDGGDMFNGGYVMIAISYVFYMGELARVFQSLEYGKMGVVWRGIKLPAVICGIWIY